MRIGTNADDDGQKRTHLELGASDLQTTGHSSRGPNHTTFHTEAGTSFTVRDINGSEAFELSAVLVCVSALSVCVLMIETSGIPAAKNIGVALVLCGLMYILLMQLLTKEARIGREILFLLAGGSMLVAPDSELLLLGFIALCMYLTVHYALLSKSRGVWEPVMAFTPWWMLVILFPLEVLPSWLLLSLFVVLTIFGLIGCMRLYVDAMQYDSAMNRMID